MMQLALATVSLNRELCITSHPPFMICHLSSVFTADMIP